MIDILPGILEKDWSSIEAKIEKVLPFASAIHIDLLDGKFAPNTSFSDPTPFLKYKDRLTLELHMMVEEPIEHVDAWAKGGITRFIGQVEKMSDQEAFVKKAKSYGEVGLAVDSPTPPEAITVSYDKLDFLFVMTVKAGFSNQSFLPEQLEKVRYFNGKTSLPIEVDGGINDQTIVHAHGAGASRFVSTGFLFGKEDPRLQYEKLLDMCQLAPGQ